MLNAKDLELVNALITCVRLIEGYKIVVINENYFLNFVNFFERAIPSEEISNTRKSSIESKINLKNGSRITIEKSRNPNHFFGKYSDIFLICKSEYTEELAGALFPNRTIALLDFDEPDYIRCAKCLCKTCQIAYENGDAEGYKDCKRCVESKQECV